VTSVAVDRMRDADAPAVTTFLEEQPTACLFHSPAWHGLLEASYGHRCDYWIARDGDTIVGVFPVTRMHVPLLGTKFVAGAYQFYSGHPIGTEAICGALVRRAVDEAAEAGAKYIEIRHHSPSPTLRELGFTESDPELELTTIPLDGLKLSSIRRNHRRNIRKATEAGVRVTEGQSLDDMRRFRRMYLMESRALGAPQAGWRFFRHLSARGAPFYRLYLAWLGDRCLGALLALDDRKTVFARYAAYGSPEAMSHHVGHLLYWHAMTTAAERGCASYNCGISWRGDSGLIHWKEGWGGTTAPAHVYVRALRGAPPVAGGYFEGFQLAKAVWRRLPLPVVGPLGHAVTRWIG
jgi:Acetyltransferase (GNAT) domain